MEDKSTDIESLFPVEASLPAALFEGLPLKQTQYLINGELREWSGQLREVLSPVHVRSGEKCDRKLVGWCPMLTEQQAQEILESAVAAYNNGRGVWPTMSVAERIEHVANFAKAMQQEKKLIVNLLMLEIGKPLGDAEKEFDRTIEYIHATVEALKELDRTSSRFVLQDGFIAQIRRAPLGVALCMGPFNYPLNETFTTLIPALIMGNTIIFKPPKLGTLLFQPLLKAFQTSFPPGVVNTLYGSGAQILGPVMQSGKVSVLAFIGTSRVADTLRKQHPEPHQLRCVLGLDAKNPAIVLPDADLALAVKECILGSLSFNGQRCTALKLLFVHEQVVGKFLDLLSTETAKLKVGMPWEQGVRITPLAEPGKPSYLSELINDATQKGARVVNPNGGKEKLSLLTPAVLYPVTKEMRIYSEEQFGPVIPVVPFTDIETPISYMVSSNFGQQVSLFGTDPETIAKLIDPLVNQVCRVNLNSQCQRGPDAFPFTGRKDSAEGTLSITDALRVFSIRTLVAAKEGDVNRELISDIVGKHRSNFLTTDFLL